MARVEKRYDRQGKLIWAGGPARDVYRDSVIANSNNLFFQIVGEPRYTELLFRVTAQEALLGNSLTLTSNCLRSDHGALSWSDTGKELRANLRFRVRSPKMWVLKSAVTLEDNWLISFLSRELSLTYALRRSVATRNFCPQPEH